MDLHQQSTRINITHLTWPCLARSSLQSASGQREERVTAEQRLQSRSDWEKNDLVISEADGIP